MCKRPVLLLAGLALHASAVAAIEMPTVAVGDPGNPDHTDRWGAVGYEFHIGTYPVTNRQYVAFLNSVAAEDPHGTYNAEMANGTHGGITRSGGNGSFTYSAKEGFENKPVNFVSFWDAARFANWLTNGQPVGPQGLETTEAGTYFLGGVTNPNQSATARDATAWAAGSIAVASHDEWFKAAYYDPTKGESGGYWSYPTRSDTLPTPSIPNSMHANSANCANAVGTVTDVGAYTLTRSYYGTYDQGGNVWEWVESDYPQQRGGSFAHDVYSLGFSLLSGAAPATETPYFGFRVSSLAAISESGPIIELHLERSTDLRTWESIPFRPDLITEDGKLRLPAGEDAKFFRLQIEPVEP